MPYNYDYINANVSQVSPNTIHVADNALTRFFVRYLLKRAISVFDWTLPELWDRNYFLYILYCYGFIGVMETDRYGVICQECSLQGVNIYYQPTNIVVANPRIKSVVMPTIGVDAALIKLQPDYCGILDLVNFYAEKMALVSQGVDINILNSRLAYLFLADNKASAQSMKKIYDDIASGNPASFADSKLFGGGIDPEKHILMFTQNIGANYIADKMLADLRTIQNDFDSYIGIANTNTQKRERMLTDEINANNQETKSLCELMLDTLRAGIKQANDIFGANISVDWRYKPNESNNEPLGTLENNA